MGTMYVLIPDVVDGLAFVPVCPMRPLVLKELAVSFNFFSFLLVHCELTLQRDGEQ